MTRTSAPNPFRFEGPLDPADLIGRERELATLVRHARDRRVLNVAAPRRYGKTSLLRAAGAALAREDGFIVAHVDLQGLSGIEDFVARFGSAWRHATRHDRRLRRQLELVAGGLSSIGVTLLGSGFQLTLRDRDPNAALTVAHALLDLPGDADAPVLVILDEFQDLHGAWPAGEGVLRSHTQSPSQAGKVSYAFAGSEPSLLAAAFEDSGRAYYQQALRLPVGRLADPELVTGIATRFTASGKDSGAAMGPLTSLAGGHPQRAMLLAHLLWELTPDAGTADAETWEAALSEARRQVRDEAVAIWESLSTAQRSALRLVLSTGSAAATSTEAVARTSRQRAASALQQRGLIELDPRPGPRGGLRYRLVDPLMGDWLSRPADRDG